eukprot:COSAG06_NODE_1486_length_9299_cov_3.915435_9_plen_98_part_00
MGRPPSLNLREVVLTCVCIPRSRYAEIGALPLIFCPVFPTVCEKIGFLSALYTKKIILPRQAGDKRRENSQKGLLSRRSRAALASSYFSASTLAWAS